MKKNISINISGVIFHIEEDGYEALKNYLDTISDYFASYEDSYEIIADIESRIAEIFLTKLNEVKNTILLSDVEDLMETMGKVADFEAAEELNDEAYWGGDAKSYKRNKKQSSGNTWADRTTATEEGTSENHEKTKPKKLYRDLNRKLIAGVASGIAHYFKIDPLWIRLLFILVNLGFIQVLSISNVGGFGFFSYILIWMFVPGSYELEDEKIKRLFRDPDGKVLGGVANGLSRYFGVEATIIRLIFVVLAPFGGLGLVAYLIIWFITPEAKSLTDRMQMDGEPITLENIEKKIKESLNLEDDEEESLLARILLFPFRLLAAVINLISTSNIKSVFKILFATIATLVGVALTGQSILVTFVLFIILLLYFGGTPDPTSDLWENIEVEYWQVEFFHNIVPNEIVMAAFFAVWIPFIFIGITGVSMIAKRWIASPIVSWGLLGIWILSALSFGMLAPNVAAEFADDATFEEEISFSLPTEPLTIDLNRVHYSDFINEVELTIRGHEEDELLLIKRTNAMGKDRANALENAQHIEYKAELEDQVLTFDTHYSLKSEEIFRGQVLRMKLYVPYNKEFKMSKSLGRILRHTLYPNNYGVRHLGENTWVFNEEGLHCTSCNEQNHSRMHRKDHSKEDLTDFHVQFGEEAFINEVKINGHFDVEVRKGEQFEVYAEGDKKHIDNLQVQNNDGDLVIFCDLENTPRHHHSMKITITAPYLNDIEMLGSIKANIQNFNEENLSIFGSGSVEVELDRIMAERLEVSLEGNSRIALNGRGELLDVQVSGNSKVDAYGFEAERVSVEASGVSDVSVFAKEDLEIESSFGSNVKYKGNPENIIREEGN